MEHERLELYALGRIDERSPHRSDPDRSEHQSRRDGVQLAPPSDRRLGISYTPFADIRGDIYGYDNVTDPETVVLNSAGTAVESETNFSSTVTRGVVDGGATVSYPWAANTSSGNAHRRTDRTGRRAPGKHPATSLAG